MENFVELSTYELESTDGGILPVICVYALCKGIGIGFGIGMAIYGAYELGHSVGQP